jgi:hypothetical protein
MIVKQTRTRAWFCHTNALTDETTVPCYSHYFVHGGWFERDRQLLEDAHKIAHIPTTIVQGVRR